MLEKIRELIGAKEKLYNLPKSGIKVDEVHVKVRRIGFLKQ